MKTYTKQEKDNHNIRNGQINNPRTKQNYKTNEKQNNKAPGSDKIPNEIFIIDNQRNVSKRNQ